MKIKKFRCDTHFSYSLKPFENHQDATIQYGTTRIPGISRVWNPTTISVHPDGKHMTPDEARIFANALLQAADMAEKFEEDLKKSEQAEADYHADCEAKGIPLYYREKKF